MDYAVIIRENDLRTLTFGRFSGHWQRVRHETCKILFECSMDNGRYFLDYHGSIMSISFRQQRPGNHTRKPVEYSINLWDYSGTHSLGGFTFFDEFYNQHIPENIVNGIMAIAREYRNGNARCHHCKEIVPIIDGQRYAFANFRCDKPECVAHAKKAMRNFSTT